MTQPGPEQLAGLARELVAATTAKGLNVRVTGGVAVYIACPGIGTHPTLQRTLKDLDFTAAAQEFEAAAQVFTAHGVAQGAKDSRRWLFYKDGAEIELTVPDFTQYYRIDLSTRLALASPTLPLADLLLIKLQRIRFEEKDTQDSIALLLDHDVGRENPANQINSEYVGKLCARNWRLFRTVYGNTVFLEQVLDKYLNGEEAQLVWRRIEAIQGDMDKEPKSLGWMVNQAIRRPHEIPA